MRLLSILLFVVSSTALGFGEPVHSKVEAQSVKGKSGLEFQFKIVPNEKMVATFDAPWKFEIKKHDGLDFKATKFKKTDMDEKLPGFTVATTAAPASAKGELEYKLTAFICTASKTHCYREVHKGKVAWNK